MLHGMAYSGKDASGKAAADENLHAQQFIRPCP